MDTIPSEVDDAFEILIEEIEEVVNKYFEALKIAGTEKNIHEAKIILERAEKLTDYRQKVSAIRREWRALENIPVEPPLGQTKKGESESRSKTFTGKLKKGQRTPEEKFYVPILESLTELNGSAPVTQVLDRVYNKMKSVLKEADLQPLKSTNMHRWRNTAMWARNNLKEEKLMKSDSAHGIWEITPAGQSRVKTHAQSKK